MNYKFLFLILSLFSFLMSCQEAKKKSDKDKIKKILDVTTELGKEEKKLKRLELDQIDFSPGVREIAEFLDYVDPLISQYSDIINVKSTADFIKLKTNNPSRIKALYLENGDAKIKIDDLSVFSNLEYLKLRNFESLPNGFYKLKKLKAYIGGSSISKMDKRIVNLANLEYIAILHTRLVLPSEIQNLKKLKSLRFFSSNYDQPYQDIFKIPNLQTLWLKLRKEEQLEGISNLKKLKTLVINKVSPEISKLKLTGLQITNNNDTTYPIELGEMESLVALYWQGNYSRESPPKFISSLKNLEYLEIRGCSKLNNIPLEYDKLTTLKQFIIRSYPKFKGKIDHLKTIRKVIHVE